MSSGPLLLDLLDEGTKLLEEGSVPGQLHKDDQEKMRVALGQSFLQHVRIEQRRADLQAVFTSSGHHAGQALR
jgi:hypothetical protein